MQIVKRYQVFVSSTYADLKEERQAVIQALLEMDCIPAGMELFPAADEEQFSFIKSVLRDCDYYIVIIGGRYGSTDLSGISYTEKEYEFAKELGLKVLAFLHEDPSQIPFGKSEGSPEQRARLQEFRTKSQTGALVKFWKDAHELPGIVALSLSKTIKTYPAIGWVRGDQATNAETLTDLNTLRKQNDRLRNEVSSLNKQLVAMTPKIVDLAKLDDLFIIRGHVKLTTYGSRDWNFQITWGELFAAIAPYGLAQPNDGIVQTHFNVVIHDFYRERVRKDSSEFGWEVAGEYFQTVKVQFMALGLFNVDMATTNKGGMALFWSLTELGTAKLLELRTVKALD